MTGPGPTSRTYFSQRLRLHYVDWGNPEHPPLILLHGGRAPVEIIVLLRDPVVPAADIITPNQFELGFLTETEPSDLDSTLASADAARAMGPSTVLVTSVERPDRAEGTIEMLAVTDDGAWIVQTPHIPMKANGSGDVTAALFTAHYHRTTDAADALARTTSSVFDLLERTHASGERELQLVESQDAYANPRLQFEVTQVR